MKKKVTRKIALKKQTISNLQNGEMNGARGGAETRVPFTGCNSPTSIEGDCPTDNTCNTDCGCGVGTYTCYKCPTEQDVFSCAPNPC